MSMFPRDIKDRNVQYPNRVTLTQVSGNTYEVAAAPGTVTDAGTNVGRDFLMVYENFLASIEGLPEKNFINLLRLKLQVALGASDIDAWSDLLVDSSNINAGASSGYVVSGGCVAKKSTTQTIDNAYGNTQKAFGITGVGKIYQTFLASIEGEISYVKFGLNKAGSPTDNLVCKIYSVSGDAPDALLYTSDEIAGSTLLAGATADWITFNFSNAITVAGTTYAAVVERTGSLDDSNYYNVWYYDDDTASNAFFGWWTGAAWTNLNPCDTYFYVYVDAPSSAIVVWNAVTPTEALTYAAVTSDETEGTGSITWYLSDDGSNWTEVTSLDEIKTVSFDEAAVCLKCVLTGSAAISAVAYGGY